jgi:two-component system LytT family response regulator
MIPQMIRTLIVDDEPAARAATRSLLAGDPEITVVGEATDGAAALRTIQQDAPELLFMDVQMPGLDGLSVLRSLPHPENLAVVFVTAYDEYALQAFDVHAVDYLLKPFDDARFRRALNRAKQEVRQRRLGIASDRLVTLLDTLGSRDGSGEPQGKYLKRIAIKSGGRVSIVPVRDLDWIEAKGDYMRLHAGKSSHLLRETMQRLEAELDPTRFVRIHRSTIVNIDRIKELHPFFKGEYVVLLQDGTQLKLSRGYRERLEGALGRPL